MLQISAVYVVFIARIDFVECMTYFDSSDHCAWSETYI